MLSDSMPFRSKILLLLASYVFMWWDPRFIVLILTSTIVDYYLGILLETATGRRKKLLFAVSLVVNLGILGFFKYYDFFAGSLADWSTYLGHRLCYRLFFLSGSAFTRLPVFLIRLTSIGEK